ncbi:MAG: diaminopimelate decarboxylase [Oscillospiraceae bacterium]|nr:diaminopimelate decarboxylase [Oscillospiraceae bacterium]
METVLTDNVTVRDGALWFSEQSTLSLAEKYGTPLYVMDERRIRQNCREYKEALDEFFGNGAEAIYAGKACCFKAIYKIIDEEGLGADLVSCGEIHTAKMAGFPLEKAYFQGNNKTDWDIGYAIDAGVGYFVCDNVEEVDVISKIAGEKGVTQKILLRLTPGIDPHTYDEVATGKVDSKFGTAIETGQAEEIAKYTLTKPNIKLSGFHCHVGSMVFDSDTFIRSAEIMLSFCKLMNGKYGYTADILDLGGGYGVRYVESQPVISIRDNIREVSEFIKSECQKLGIPLPSLRLEPGRSIVADAGMTLYTVGTVKKITGYKNYVSIDGGMTDNPRYALYHSQYTVLTANKASEKKTLKCDLVGRCCESGDIIQPDVMFPESITRGDTVAVLTTGAYNYSMASNYNRIARPAVVMVDGEKDYLAVRRESLEDLTANDL